MKMLSIAGIVYKVQDLQKTADFYEKLGFIVTKQTEKTVSVRLNWFWIDFCLSDEGLTPNSGQSTYIKVDDVDEFYRNVLSKAFKPENMPKKTDKGNYQFVLKDPDEYKLVFFNKTK